MGTALIRDCLEEARKEAASKGFRSTGIYHLLWVVKRYEPEEFLEFLGSYSVDPAIFVKLMEVVLRPRRSGGGLPSDAQDARMLEQALALLTRRAGGEHGDIRQFLGVIPEMNPDPIEDLCRRFALNCGKKRSI